VTATVAARVGVAEAVGPVPRSVQVVASPPAACPVKDSRPTVEPPAPRTVCLQGVGSFYLWMGSGWRASVRLDFGLDVVKNLLAWRLGRCRSCALGVLARTGARAGPTPGRPVRDGVLPGTPKTPARGGDSEPWPLGHVSYGKPDSHGDGYRSRASRRRRGSGPRPTLGAGRCVATSGVPCLTACARRLGIVRKKGPNGRKY
jgi:hypothetical protein